MNVGFKSHECFHEELFQVAFWVLTLCSTLNIDSTERARFGNRFALGLWGLKPFEMYLSFE